MGRNQVMMELNLLRMAHAALCSGHFMYHYAIHLDVVVVAVAIQNSLDLLFFSPSSIAYLLHN